MKQKINSLIRMIIITLNISAIYDIVYNINNLLQYESWLEYFICIVILGCFIAITFKVMANMMSQYKKKEQYTEFELAKGLVQMQAFNTIALFTANMFDRDLSMTAINIVLFIYTLKKYSSSKKLLKKQLMIKIINIQKELLG